MIDGITLQNLRNAEFLRFLKNVLAIYLANNPGNLKVQEQYDTLNAMIATLDSLFKVDQSNPMTDELTDLDARRDNAINGISGYVNSFAYHFDADVRKNASLLINNLAVYGTGVARENYQSETEIIGSIVDDWTGKPELAAAVTALRLGDWKAELAGANSDFDTKYIVRTRQLGAASPDTMKAKRLEAANLYYSLRDFTVSFYTINKGAEPYATVVNELNALIRQYNVLLAGRAATPPATPAPSV